MRYLIALLASAGIVVSVLALRVHYSTESAPCSINEKWDCGIVNHSPYAVVYGVPVAALGIAGYLLIADSRAGAPPRLAAGCRLGREWPSRSISPTSRPACSVCGACTA